MVRFGLGDCDSSSTESSDGESVSPRRYCGRSCAPVDDDDDVAAQQSGGLQGASPDAARVSALEAGVRRMRGALRAERRVEWPAERPVSPAVLAVFTNHDLLVRLSVDSPRALFVSKQVARDAPAAALAVRKLIWQDRISKGTAIFKGHIGPICKCALSPDGKRIVTAHGRALLWDAETGALQAMLETAHKGHTYEVMSYAFSPDGKRLVTASGYSHLPDGDPGTVRLWDTKTGALLTTLELQTSVVFSCAFSPDGKCLVTASYDNLVRLWEVETSALLTILEGHTDYVPSCAFSPDGKRLLTASGGTVRLWDAETGALQAPLEGYTGHVDSCAFSPDGERVVTASSDTTVRLRDTITVRQWDTKSGALLTTLAVHIGRSEYYAFSPDWKRVVTWSRDRAAQLLDAETGALLTTIKHTGYGPRYMMRFAFSPDGTRLVTASGDKRASHDGTVRLWDAATGALLTTLEGHTGAVNCCALSLDGKRILTGSFDGTARLYNGLKL